MADVKISALPAATTPLAGTEVLPIVQGGTTDKVSVANLTAGRSVAAAALEIDANSASAAVRITQTGAGNVLVVEDSTTPDATPFVIDADGYTFAYAKAMGYVQGDTTKTNALGLATIGLISWTGNSTGNQLTLGQQVSSSTSPIAGFYKSRGGNATPTVVSSGDSVGSLRFFAHDGTSFIRAGQIDVAVDGTPGTNDMPGRIVFAVTPDGTATPTEALRVSNNQLTSLTGSFGRGAPVTKTGNFTLAATENWVICNGTGSITVTLPTASSWTGREVMIKTIAAQTVVSASSNVVPLAGGAAGTAILAATAGKWATLVSDGTNWVIMAAA